MIHFLLDLREVSSETANAIIQLSRRTDDRTRDIDEGVRESVLSELQAAGVADESVLRQLTEFVMPDRTDVARTFGEPLPKGLHLQSTADCLSPVSAIAVES